LEKPNDPVWWVDLLSPEQFEEGFGSHTPMITGEIVQDLIENPKAKPTLFDTIPCLREHLES
jgi:hypothetical protein